MDENVWEAFYYRKTSRFPDSYSQSESQALAKESQDLWILPISHPAPSPPFPARASSQKPLQSRIRPLSSPSASAAHTGTGSHWRFCRVLDQSAIVTWCRKIGVRDRLRMLGCADNEYPLKSTALLHFLSLDSRCKLLKMGLSFVRDG